MGASTTGGHTESGPMRTGANSPGRAGGSWGVLGGIASIIGWPRAWIGRSFRQGRRDRRRDGAPFGPLFAARRFVSRKVRARAFPAPNLPRLAGRGGQGVVAGRRAIAADPRALAFGRAAAREQDALVLVDEVRLQQAEALRNGPGVRDEATLGELVIHGLARPRREAPVRSRQTNEKQVAVHLHGGTGARFDRGRQALEQRRRERRAA